MVYELEFCLSLSLSADLCLAFHPHSTSSAPALLAELTVCPVVVVVRRLAFITCPTLPLSRAPRTAQIITELYAT
ncbi:unnamed protein product [Strongylus vulgaris]|uniref:Uncharacterized protein n=1 Tax=Strongylus vulgaris TaxID=40348 RepID=A0A3P7J1J9_STRVU|nr:unnamed protein product [Strongylus vulgaris]